MKHILLSIIFFASNLALAGGDMIGVMGNSAGTMRGGNGGGGGVRPLTFSPTVGGEGSGSGGGRPLLLGGSGGGGGCRPSLFRVSTGGEGTGGGGARPSDSIFAKQ